MFDSAGKLTGAYGAADVPFLCLIGTDGKVLALGSGWQVIGEVSRILSERLTPPDREE